MPPSDSEQGSSPGSRKRSWAVSEENLAGFGPFSWSSAPSPKRTCDFELPSPPITARRQDVEPVTGKILEGGASRNRVSLELSNAEYTALSSPDYCCKALATSDTTRSILDNLGCCSLSQCDSGECSHGETNQLGANIRIDYVCKSPVTVADPLPGDNMDIKASWVSEDTSSFEPPFMHVANISTSSNAPATSLCLRNGLLLPCDPSMENATSSDSEFQECQLVGLGTKETTFREPVNGQDDDAQSVQGSEEHLHSSTVSPAIGTISDIGQSQEQHNTCFGVVR